MRLILLALVGVVVSGCEHGSAMLTGEALDVSGIVRTAAPLGTRPGSLRIDVVDQIECYVNVDHCVALPLPPAQLRDAPPHPRPGIRVEEEYSRSLARFELHVGMRDPVRAAAARDAIVGSLLWASERNCQLYLSDLRGWQIAHRSALGLAEIVVDTVGAITTNEVTSRAMSSVSGAITATSNRFDSEAFASTAVQLTTAKIEASMAVQRTAIRARFNTRYQEWRLGDAISEVEHLHQHCDMRIGLELLQQDAGPPQADQTAREALRTSARGNLASLLRARADQHDAAAEQWASRVTDLQADLSEATDAGERRSLRQAIANAQNQARLERQRAAQARQDSGRYERTEAPTPPVPSETPEAPPAT